MKIELWIAGDLTRSPGRSPDEHPKLMTYFYEDDESTGINQALERAWLITNGAINRLEGKDLEHREIFHSIAPGQTLSVGDLVHVDSRWFECKPQGFEEVQDPQSNRLTTQKAGHPNVGTPGFLA
jgi:hypothetical protein